MKILIVSFAFPPNGGGVAEVARTQASGLAGRGHQVTVATEFSEDRENRDALGNITVRQFKLGGLLGLNLPDPSDLNEYQRLVQSQDFDIVLINCWQNRLTDLALLVLNRSRAKKVMVSHGFDAHVWKFYPGLFLGLGAWLRAQPYVWRLPRMMKAFNRLVFLSDRRDSGRFFDHWIAARFLPSRVSVIPNGVHLSEFAVERPDFRKSYGIQTEHLLLNVANYCDRKNQLATLRDFMKANRADAALVFIGEQFNDYQAQMTRVYNQMKLRFPSAKVFFLEKVSKSTVYAAYQAATIFVLGAKAETQPLAILDAMAAGVPFISTNTGCVSEFPGGILARSGPNTTRVIHQLLNDPQLRRQLGTTGRAACETKYDWQRVLDTYEALFARLGRIEAADLAPRH